MRVLDGNIGRAIVKISAVAVQFRKIGAPARVFASQEEFIHSFERGELETDFVAVLPAQARRRPSQMILSASSYNFV